jgi:outer membrane protein assembly factor BamB
MSPAPSMPAPKRVAPPKVKPVTIGDVRYEAIHWGRERELGQNGGYIAALDATTGAELWTLKVYDIAYDDRMEEDVQDRFIKSLKADASGLLVTDEDGCRYSVDLETRTVKPL